MANLLKWLGNEAGSIASGVQHGVANVVRTDIVNPARELAAQATNNQVALQNAQQAQAKSVAGTQQFLQPIARTVPEAIGTLVHPFNQFSYHPNSPLETAIFGKTPVQNIQAKVAGNYNAHKNLPFPQRVGLAGLEGAGSLLQDVPVGTSAVKLGKAAKLPEAVSTVRAYDRAQNQIGAVGKNVNGLPPKNFLKQDPKVVAQNARILNISKAKAAEALNSKLPPETKTVVNRSLSKMPPPTATLPKTSPLATGDLVPMRNLPVRQKLFSNKVTALRQINTPSSHALADKITNVEADRQALQSQWMHSIPTVRGLSKGDFSNFVDSVQKEGKPANAKVAQAVKEWNQLTPKVAQAGKDQGLLLNGSRQNFFPHQYEVTKPGSSKWDNQLQYLIDTKKIDHQTAVNLLEDHNKNVGLDPSRFGSFDYSRESNLPGYHKDVQAVNDYLAGAANRIARNKHLGPDNQVASKLLDNVRIEGGDLKSAKDAVSNYLKTPEGGIAAKPLAGARGVFGAMSLSKAPISHLGQSSNVDVIAGFGRTNAARARWVGTKLGLNKNDREFISKTGLTNPQELHSYRDQYTSVKGLTSKVTAVGLNPVMSMNRGISALAGRMYGQHLAEKGAISELRSYGVTGKIGKELTPAQEVQIGRGMGNKTMFSGSRATTPIYAETTAGKTIGQFRTAYLYKQTGYIYNNVIKPARQGNLAPLARYLAITGAATGGTIAAKNAISGSKEGPGGIGLDVAGALGGIPGELLIQGARYGSRAGNLVKTAAGEVAPLASEAMTVGGNIDSLVHGKAAPIARTALKSLPIVGNRVSAAALPSANAPSGPSAPGATANQPFLDRLLHGSSAPAATLPKNSAKAQKDSTKIVDNLKNTANTGDYSVTPLPNGKFAVSAGGDVSTVSNLRNANLAVDKAKFVDSGKDFQVIGNNVWQLTPDGTATHKTQGAYQSDLNTATMTEMKNAGNLTGYVATAQSELKNISAQMKDPNTTPLEAITLQNKATTLQKDISKYSGYGGFTKPKSGKSSTAISSLKTAGSFRIKAPTGIKVKKLSAPTFKSTTKKLSVSRIPTSASRRKLA